MLTRSYLDPGSSKNILAYTPMIHSRMFIEKVKFRDRHFQPTRSGLSTPPSSELPNVPSDLYLDGNPKIDRPLFVQFCANSPDEFLEAAKYVEPFCDAVDLNLGCPQGIARKGRYGAFLQEDWGLIYELINKLHKHLNVPVTAKMRILETRERTLEYAKVIVSAGAGIITVHGRQRDQKGHKTGLADWSVIRYLRENLPKETVIFANGNILQHEDIERCLKETGADGVMSAEGNLHDPTIFAKPPDIGHEGHDFWRGRDNRGGFRMDAVFRRYMDILYLYVLERTPPSRKPLFLASEPLSEAVLETEIVDKEYAYKPHPGRKREFNEDTSTNNDVQDGEESANEIYTRRTKRQRKAVKTTSPNLLSMQAHLFQLLRPLIAKHTNIRDALARCQAGDIEAFENVLSLVEKVVKEGILDYKFDPSKYEEDLPIALAGEQSDQDEDDSKSSAATVRKCKRPWWVCQPYVRPLPSEALEKGSLTLSKMEKRQQEAVKAAAEICSPQPSARENCDGADAILKEQIPKHGVVCG